MSRRDRPLRPLWHLVPSGASVPFVVLGVAWLLLCGSCMVVLTVAEIARGDATAASLASGALVLGFLLFPVSALFLFVGALLAGRWAARAVLLAATLGTLLLGAGASASAMLGDPDPMSGLVVVVILFAVPVGGVAITLLLSTLWAVREVRASIEAARRTRLQQLLTARGEVAFDTLARELRLPPEPAVALLEELSTSGELPAVLDREAQMAFTAPRYAQKARDLASVVWGRGKASLPELAAELRLSPGRLHGMLAAAMESGTFTGFFDARTGEIVSAEASELRHGRTCPACGGQMDLAGHGLVVCGYCRAEIFLTTARAAR